MVVDIICAREAGVLVNLHMIHMSRLPPSPHVWRCRLWGMCFDTCCHMCARRTSTSLRAFTQMTKCHMRRAIISMCLDKRL